MQIEPEDDQAPQGQQADHHADQAQGGGIGGREEECGPTTPRGSGQAAQVVYEVVQDPSHAKSPIHSGVVKSASSKRSNPAAPGSASASRTCCGSGIKCCWAYSVTLVQPGWTLQSWRA